MATGKKGKSLIPDPRSLASEHHMVIVSCLGFLATKSVSSSNPVKVLIIGLGGGSLPRFIDHHLTNVGGLTRPIGGALGEVLNCDTAYSTWVCVVWCEWWAHSRQLLQSFFPASSAVPSVCVVRVRYTHRML